MGRPGQAGMDGQEGGRWAEERERGTRREIEAHLGYGDEMRENGEKLQERGDGEGE